MVGITKTSCKKIPLDGVIRTSLSITPYTKGYIDYDRGYSYSNYYYNVIIKLYNNSNCSGEEVSYVYSPNYKIQTFNIHFDSNGGNKYRWDEVIKVYNYVNPLDIIPPNKSSENNSFSIRRNGYNLIGFKAKDSKNRYACYKNIKKTSQGFTDAATCNRYGYVLYDITDRLSRTSSVNGETITFVAHWVRD